QRLSRVRAGGEGADLQLARGVRRVPEEQSEELSARVARSTCDCDCDCHTHEYASTCNLLHTRPGAPPLPVPRPARPGPEVPPGPVEPAAAQVHRAPGTTPVVDTRHPDPAPGTAHGGGETGAHPLLRTLGVRAQDQPRTGGVMALRHRAPFRRRETTSDLEGEPGHERFTVRHRGDPR